MDTFYPFGPLNSFLICHWFCAYLLLIQTIVTPFCNWILHCILLQLIQCRTSPSGNAIPSVYPYSNLREENFDRYINIEYIKKVKFFRLCDWLYKIHSLNKCVYFNQSRQFTTLVDLFSIYCLIICAHWSRSNILLPTTKLFDLH